MEILLFIAVLLLGGLLGDVRARLKRAEQRLAELEQRARIDGLERGCGDEGATTSPTATAQTAPAPSVASPTLIPEQPADPVVPVRDGGDGGVSRQPVSSGAPAGSEDSPSTYSGRADLDGEREQRGEASAGAAVPRHPALPPRPAPAPRPAKPAFAFSFEDFFGRKLPIWAGGITLAVAGVLIVNYALSAGLLTPWVQVAAALMFGFGLLAGAEAAQRNTLKVGDPRVAQALAGAGLATLYAAAFVAGNVHGLIGPLATFVAMAVVTAGALALAARFGAPTALLALAGGFATPALVGSAEPNIPLLAAYLALTVAGLTAVGRSQRWAWLGIATLAGGGLWTLALIASGALDFASSLSVGLLVIGLAVAAPLMGHTGARAGLVRTLALLAGLAQLGALVATGGYALPTWGMYLLLAAAGQWLAWREPGFAMVPRLSAGLAAVLLFLWPDAPVAQFALVGLAMLLVHAVPLHLKLWKPGGLQAATDLSVIAIAAFLLPGWRYGWMATMDELRLSNMVLAGVALGAALITGIGLSTGWRSDERQGDIRYAQLAAVTALLVAVAGMLGLAQWTIPLTLAALAAVLLFGGEQAGDARFERLALGFAAAAVVALMIVGTGPLAGQGLEHEWLRLIGEGGGHPDGLALLRWGAVAATLGLIAWRAKQAQLTMLAQIAAAFVGYGALAQLLPRGLLMFAPGVALVALAVTTRRAAWPRLAPGIAVAVLLLLGWVLNPLAQWAALALESLAGVPLVVDERFPTISALVRQLLVPALLLGAAAWLLAGRAVAALPKGLAAIAGLLGIVALHGLYRQAVAGLMPDDFVVSGIPQRLLWEALLIGAAFAAARLGGRARWPNAAVTALAGAALAHGLVYGLIIHNPLWSDQSVGALPAANWLLPLHLLPAIAAWLLLRDSPAMAKAVDPVVQVAAMLLVALFAFATLRHWFSGTLLMAAPVGQVEDVLRSVLAILLAIGFLLWGARKGRRDWRIASLVLMLGAVAKVFLADAAGLEGLLRIASFVALGFSLIGIGWFYSKQLRSDGGAEPEPQAENMSPPAA